MNISPAQLISGEITPAEKAFDLISSMIDSLHPTMQMFARMLLENLRKIFQASEDLYTKGIYWQYTVTEPHPFRYALRALERGRHGWVTSAESTIFTDDHSVAEAAAELLTRYSLSPIHLEDAIEDFMLSTF